VTALTLVSGLALGQTFTMTDGGASATITAANGTMTNFVVGGVDHAFQHTYFLRNGDGGAAVGLGSLTLNSATQPLANFVQLNFSNATFSVQIRYLLTGAGMQADMAESVVVTNVSNSSASLRLFQYSDWDIANTAANDTVTRLNSSTMQQTDGVFSGHTAVHGGTPIPEFSGMSAFATIRTNILGTNGYFLDTAAGAGIGQSFTGDATYAFQWNRDLAAGASFTLSTDKVMAVPEPGSMIALGLGAAALLARRRRKAA
jgi:hypothetical protein